jgi:hypothetical protein
MHWLRLYTEIIDHEKIRMLAFEDRWHYVAILCCKRSGMFDEQDQDFEFFQRRLAVKLGLQKVELESLQKRLIDVHLIDEKWNPTGWEIRQPKSDKDQTNAERQKRFRDKRRNQNTDNALRNVTVTTLELELERELEKDITTTNVVVCKSSDELLPTTSKKEEQKPKIPYQEIVNLYQEVLPMLNGVYKLTDVRKKKIERLWREDELSDIKHWRNYFTYVGQSKFLTGRAPPGKGNEKPFKADLDWLINYQNYIKITEEKYHEPEPQGRR